VYDVSNAVDDFIIIGHGWGKVGEAGHIRVEVFTARTVPEMTTRIRLVQDAAGFKACLHDGVVSTMRSSLVGHGEIDSASTANLVAPASVARRAFRTTMTYHFDGSPKVMYVDTISVEAGRALVNVEFDHCCAPFPATFELAVLDALVARVTADFRR
jgi:hypothetical protein